MRRRNRRLFGCLALLLCLAFAAAPALARTPSDYGQWQTAQPVPAQAAAKADKRDRFLAIAASQIGYISDNAHDRHSVYSKFIMERKGIRTWGKNQRLWCSEYASWCMFAAGLKNWKPSDTCPDFRANYAGRYFRFSTKGEKGTKSLKDLRPGDIIQVNGTAASPKHTAIVEYVKNGRAYVIEGNKPMRFFQDTRGVIGKKGRLYACNEIGTDHKAYYRHTNGKRYLRTISADSDKYRGVRRYFYKPADIRAVIQPDFS